MKFLCLICAEKVMVRPIAEDEQTLRALGLPGAN